MTPNDAGTMGRDEAVEVLYGYSQQHGNPEDLDLAIAATLRAQSSTEERRGLAEAWRELAKANAAVVDEIRDVVGLTGKPGNVVEAVRKLVAMRDGEAKQPAAEGVQAGEVHPDDAAVDAFAAAMKEKLAAARAKGRGGWNGDEPGMQQRLSDMLRAHVEKGDPRDVANFCMFLHQRGESILSQQPAAVFRNDGNTEADFIAHEANACTACGGSGHKADQQPAPVAPVGVEASYHPCTHILIDGLKRLEGGAAVLAEWDRARAQADAALAAKHQEPTK